MDDFLESIQSKFQKYHKKNNIIEKSKTRIENQRLTRRESRLQKMDEHRNLKDAITPKNFRGRPDSPKKPSSPHIDRLTKLKMWRKERDKKLEEQKAVQKKPTFKVGAAKNVGFPALKPDTTSFAPCNHVFKAPKNVKPLKMKNEKSQVHIARITRSQKPVASPPLPLPVHTRKKSAKSAKENQPNKEKQVYGKTEVNRKVLKRQDALDETSKRRKSMRKSLTSTENLQEKTSTKTPEKTTQNILNNITPENNGAYISPFVTISRGKGSIRKENLNRSFKGLPNFKESENDKSAAYFFTVLQNEINRLEDMCNSWSDYKTTNSNVMSEDATDLIDVAVGQAKLLISKKFQQFNGLITACQTGVGAEKEVTVEDLQGFWDMVYMQVENLNTRFERLRTMRDNNWEEIEPTLKPKVVKKRAPAKTSKPAASSGIRAAILAARKKKQEEKQPAPDPDPKEESVFDGGFFVVRTPHKDTPTQRTPKPTPKSILKKAKKKSIVSMNKSVLFKDEDSDSDLENKVEELNTTFEKTPAKKERRRSSRK